MRDRDRLVELITEKQLWGIDQIQPNGFKIELFENLETWTKECFELSWLEFITKKYGNGLRFNDNLMFWARPKEWNEVFRNLLRQTYIDADFLKSRWGEKSMSDNEIPWELWKKEFEYGI